MTKQEKETISKIYRNICKIYDKDPNYNDNMLQDIEKMSFLLAVADQEIKLNFFKGIKTWIN